MRSTLLIVLAFILLSMNAIDLTAYEKRKDITKHLSKVTKIDGYFCRGWITTTDKGQLVTFDSAAPIQMRNGIIPTGSRIVLYSNLKIQSVCLGKPTRIQGLLCIGHGPESPPVTFYPDGNLKICYLVKDTWIQGILCHHGYFSRVILYSIGTLRSCELSKAQTIQGQKLKARTIVSFDEFGKIIEIRKSNPVRSLFFDILDKVL